jgi:hypothetical protein
MQYDAVLQSIVGAITRALDDTQAAGGILHAIERKELCLFKLTMSSKACGQGLGLAATHTKNLQLTLALLEAALQTHVDALLASLQDGDLIHITGPRRVHAWKHFDCVWRSLSTTELSSPSRAQLTMSTAARSAAIARRC